MDGKSQPVLCVVGSACVDYLITVRDFPKKGETISAEDYHNASGGKGANMAVGAAKLGLKTYFTGQFGKDATGDMIEIDMKHAGVDMKYLRRLEHVKTACGFVTISESGQNHIVIVGGANMHYDDLKSLPKEYKEAIDQSSYILMQREIPHEMNVLVAKYAKSQGKLVILDYGGRDEPCTDELLEQLDIISPNETELERIIGSYELDEVEHKIRERLLSKFPKLTVLLKLGEHGCGIITKNDCYTVTAVTKINKKILDEFKIVDVTGAGDCFMGAFFTRYSQLKGTLSEKELYTKCMKYANCAAFLSITKRGCIPVFPNKDDVDNLVNKYLKDWDC